MKWTKELVENTYAQAKEKAASDPEFAKKLLEAPEKAVEELTGFALPENYKIRVIEKGGTLDGFFYDEALYNAGELSDEAMESIAGGACGYEACGANATACGKNN